MQSIYFDVDDTLYDQRIPFENAFRQAFPEISVKKKEELYQLFRRKSDEVFPKFQKKLISEEEMWIMRMTHTLNTLGIQNISQYQILNFQQKYNLYLFRIQPYPEIINLIHTCLQANVHVGIITNGTKQHQLNKIKQLGILDDIAITDVFISESLRVAKPDPSIFKKVMQSQQVLPEQAFYLGDNFRNDIYGSKMAGMHAIWLNLRQQRAVQGNIQPDLEIKTLDNLPLVLNQIQTTC